MIIIIKNVSSLIIYELTLDHNLKLTSNYLPHSDIANKIISYPHHFLVVWLKPLSATTSSSLWSPSVALGLLLITIILEWSLHCLLVTFPPSP